MPKPIPLQRELDALHQREQDFRAKGWFYDANRLAIQWYKLVRKTPHHLPPGYIDSQIRFFESVNKRIPPKLRRPLGITTLIQPSKKGRRKPRSK